MKTKLIILGVLFFAISNVYAQDEKILIGIKGGLNIASISNNGGGSTVTFGSTTSSYKNKVKFLPHAGAYAELKINDFFSVQPELLFSMKGYGSESKVSSGPSNSSEYKGSLVLSYIDIPVQARFNLGKGFHLLAGPYIGILLAAKSKDESTVISGSTKVMEESTSTSKSGLQTTDVGVYIGAGYELESGLSFGLRWCKGFTDITKASTAAYGYYVANPANTNSVL